MAEILQEPIMADTPYVGEIITGDGISANDHARKTRKLRDSPGQADRPGWIPKEILYDWDTDPYAYQTEEELMPGGGPHGRLLGHIMGITEDYLEEKDLMFLLDVFLLYRDARGVRQRIGPDLLLMPFCSETPSAYDLDTEPLPLLVAEVTSPESRAKDMGDKILLYVGKLGIPAYLVIDLLTSRGKPRDQIGLRLWRSVGGQIREIPADTGGWLAIPEMGVRMRARGRKLVFADIVTGETLHSAGQLREQAELAEAQAEQEKSRAEQAEAQAEQEKSRAEQAETLAKSAEEKIRRLEEKLRAAGIFSD